MSLKFIIGIAGSGKTRNLYDDLIRRSVSDPDSGYITIVPEQFTMQTQKEIVCLHPDHGTMNIDIVSFNRLAYRVFEELSVELPSVLDDMGKSMVLRKTAADQKKNLKLYGGHLNRTGFINQLKSMLSELYQYGIRPEDLDRVGEEADTALLKEKCRDLALIFRAFKKEIEDRFVTAEEILDVLCHVLPDSELIRQSVITLDGYTGFTPVQYRLLELMMVYAKQVIVTVTADPDSQPYQPGKPQDLFRMGKEIIHRLTVLAEKNGVKRDEDLILRGRFSENASISFIERHLYRYGKGADWKPETVEVFRTRSISGEAAAVASRIHSMVRNQGLRYREIAVITGDLPGYGNEIANRFQLEGIPCFLDDKKNILENALVEFVRAALETVRRDFDYESVFRVMKTGLVTDDREELDRLENYCIALGIRGYDRWNREWDMVSRGGETLNMDQLNRFRQQVLAPLGGLRRALGEDHTVGAMTQAVLQCMESCQVREKLEWYRDCFEKAGEYSLAREYDQVYDRVVELFGRLTGVLGKETVSLKEYNEILDAGLAEIQVGVIPATVDRVVVGDITRTRLDQIRVLFFVGVSEGVVPGKKEGQGLLTDMDREVFRKSGLELAPTSKEDSFIQRYYLYLVLTKPTDRLILSYPMFDQAGKSLRPSSLINELKRMFPLLETEDEEENGTEITSLNGGRDQLIRGLPGYADGQWSEEEENRFLELYRWFSERPQYRNWVESLTDAAFYAYDGGGISREAARALYGTALQGSVTRLERYAACACAHFLSYGLELSERPEYRVQAVDMGNLFHSAIDLCFRTAGEQGISLTEISDQDRDRLADQAVDQVTARYGNTIFQSSARNRYLVSRVRRMTERTLWALTEQLKKGDFQPAGFEVSFSALDQLEAMRIRLSEEEQLQLRGRIDRLDLCRDGDRVYVKIIDYKSGETEFDLAEVSRGLQLQLTVYMDAVMELIGRRNPGREMVPAGIFYYHIKDPFVDRIAGQTEEDIDDRILKELKMDGLVNSDLAAIRHMDRQIQSQSDIIPVALKDGLIQENRSSVASSRRFQVLRQYVREEMRQAGREILAGQTQARPHKEGKQTACDYCPYHGVCGFDTRIAGYRFRRFAGETTEEIWARMESLVGEEAEPTAAEEKAGRKEAEPAATEEKASRKEAEPAATEEKAGRKETEPAGSQSEGKGEAADAVDR